MGKGYSFRENYAKKNYLIYDITHGIQADYPVVDPNVLYQKGAVVTLTNTGEVDFATGGDFPFGYVCIANIVGDTSSPNWNGHVTVCEFAMEHVYGEAAGAIPIGELVTADGVSTTDANLMIYKVASVGEAAIGVALSAAAAAADGIVVALLNSPVIIP